MTTVGKNTPETTGGSEAKIQDVESPKRAEDSIIIRNLREEDYPEVRAILQEGMNTGEATFEAEAPEWEDFRAARLLELTFVAEDEATGKILGWIAASPASQREVFHGVIEDSIYMSSDAKGRGVGGKLLDTLIAEATKAGRWSIHSHIFPENEGSVRLHVSRGFELVGTFHSMAKMSYGPKKDAWRDNQVYELVLEEGPARNGE
ncbi:MAG TPA: N-acetyltransferase family protein [Corynebacterium urealyticum]|nr:N-acetyltransferase family protein [Corynebacterium urealyticum]